MEGESKAAESADVVEVELLLVAVVTTPGCLATNKVLRALAVASALDIEVVTATDLDNVVATVLMLDSPVVGVALSTSRGGVVAFVGLERDLVDGISFFSETAGFTMVLASDGLRFVGKDESKLGRS